MFSIIMMTAAVGIADANADAAAALALAKAKRQREQVTKVEPVPVPAAKATTVKVVDPSSHVHRCQTCGHEWSHPNSSAGDRTKHTCPKCGVELPRPWWPSERGVRIKAAKVTYREVVEAVEAGESLTVSVGFEGEADCWVDSIPETEPGLWKCYKQDGNLMMKREDPPTPAPMVFQNVLNLSGSR